MSVTNEPVVPATPPVHVFTDEQFQALLAMVKPNPTVISAGTAAVKGSADAVLASIKQTIADAEGAVGHVHGAAKALQADLKADWKNVLALVMATAALVLHFLPFLSGVKL